MKYKLTVNLGKKQPVGDFIDEIKLTSNDESNNHLNISVIGNVNAGESIQTRPEKEPRQKKTSHTVPSFENETIEIKSLDFEGEAREQSGERSSVRPSPIRTHQEAEVSEFSCREKELLGISSINDLSFSQTSNLIATLSDGVEINLWSNNGEKPKLLKSLNRNQSKVNALAISPDGNTISTVYETGEVTFWHVSTPAFRHSFDFEKEFISKAIGVDFFQGENAIAIGEKDGSIIRIDLETGAENYRTAATGIFSPNGRVLATSDRSGEVKLHEVSTGRTLFTLLGHEGRINCIAFTPCGQTLATGGADGSIKLWDTATGIERTTLFGHKDQIQRLGFSYDSRFLFSLSDDNTVLVWESQVNVTGKE